MPLLVTVLKGLHSKFTKRNLILSSQLSGDLDPAKPFLSSPLLLHVFYIVLKYLTLSPDRLEYLRHLYPRISDLPLLPLSEYLKRFCLLMHLHHLSLDSVSHYRLC
jgi:hypothetical protein